MSVLSQERDGAGYWYGFYQNDPRQINVCIEGTGCLLTYVGDACVAVSMTKDEAEERAIAWIKENPPVAE